MPWMAVSAGPTARPRPTASRHVRWAERWSSLSVSAKGAPRAARGEAHRLHGSDKDEGPALTLAAVRCRPVLALDASGVRGSRHTLLDAAH